MHNIQRLRYLCAGMFLKNVIRRHIVSSSPLLSEATQERMVCFHQLLLKKLLSSTIKDLPVFPCWNCHKKIEGFLLKCQFCSSLQPPRPEVTHFNLFNEDAKYDIDTAQLKRKFLKLQAEFHPDKFSTKDEKEKIISEEISSVINKAYSTLSNPYKRGLYILEVNNISFNESEIQLDPSFLGKIMELNEELEDIKTKQELYDFEEKNSHEIDQLASEVSNTLSVKDYKSAKLNLQRMKYFISIRSRLKNLKAVLQ